MAEDAMASTIVSAFRGVVVPMPRPPAFGEVNGRRCLVRFLDISFVERRPEEGPDNGEEAFGSLVSLDNAAYFLTLIAAEIAEAVKDYETISAAGATPGEPSILQAMKVALPSVRESRHYGSQPRPIARARES